MIDTGSILLTFAQICVAFVGFAAIIATFQFKDGYEMKKNDALSLEMIIITGLGGTFFSVFPLVLSNFNLSADSVWGISSAVMCVNYVYCMRYMFKNVEISKFRRRISKVIISSYFFFGTIVLILNLCNALNIVFKREFGPYFVSLAFPLCIIGYMFYKSLFIPIWRSLKNKKPLK